MQIILRLNISYHVKLEHMTFHIIHVLSLELTLIALILIALVVLQKNVFLQVELSLRRVVTLIALVCLVTRVLVQNVLAQLISVRAGHVAHGTLDFVDVFACVLLQQVVRGELFVAVGALEHQIAGITGAAAMVDESGDGGEERTAYGT